MALGDGWFSSLLFYAYYTFQTFYDKHTLREGEKKRKGSASGERNRDRKRRAGLKGRWGGEPVWGLPWPLPGHAPTPEGITFPGPVRGCWLPQPGGLSARGLHLGQPLLQAAEVAV